MANDYNNRQGQGQTGQGGNAVDKASEFARSTGEQAGQKGKEIAFDAQKLLKEGQEQASKVMETVDKQVRQNPWPVIAGVAIISFLFGSVMNRSGK